MERRLKDKLKDGNFGNVPAVRSKTMAAIRGKDNKSTERRFRLALVRSSLKGWVCHPADLPGHPDFYFPDANLAIFLDGCFWHGCPRCGHVPRTNQEFWGAKIQRNRQRDKQKARQLKATGIRTIRFWEHSLSDSNKVIDRLRKALGKSSSD